MFVDEPDTGLVISGLRRYNLFTALFFFGRQRGLLSRLVSRSDLRAGEDVLDIGCGPGKLVRAMGRQVGPGGSVTGVDPSAEAIAYNQRRDPHHRYLRSPAQQLPLPDDGFDVVTCTFVMHHIAEPYRDAALNEMWRVLRPGGRLLLADAHSSGFVRAVAGGWARIRGRKPIDPLAGVDIRRYVPRLTEIGFAEPQFVAVGHHTATLLSTKPH